MPLHQAAGDAGGRRALARWDDDPHAVVPTAPHRTPAGVHHETDQETAQKRQHTNETAHQTRGRSAESQQTQTLKC